MIVGLGIAFRNQPVERITVDVEQSPRAEAVEKALAARRAVRRGHLLAEERLAPAAQRPHGAGRARPSEASGAEPRYDYHLRFVAARERAGRNAADDALQRAAGRKDLIAVDEHAFDEPGGRYIDFLVPGLLGMSLMGGGLWGVGFVTVDMRIRKLLKRFLATPMRRGDFLAGVMISRLLFMVPEVLVLLAFAWLAFGVVVYGSLLAVLFLILLGAVMFAGLGLLVASRAKTLEAVSGLMNLVMLPMWMLSGIFFSSERFPAAVQPAIKILPLTALINALRAVMQDGASLASQAGEIGILAVWAVVTFALALRWFRWM